MKFSDLATIRKQTVRPSEFGDYSIYLGFEHLDPGALRISAFGSPATVTSTKQRFLPGDTIYGKLRPYFRKVAYVADSVGICSTDLWVFQPKPGVDPRFVFYVAASQEFTDLANASSEGTRMPRASWSVVKDFEIRDTPIEEQRVIAATLGALDDKIESNLLIIARGLELLDAMAAALTDSLPFVELRSFALLSRATVNPVILKDQLVDHFSLPAFDVAARPERVPANSIMSNKILLSQKSVLVSRLNPRTNRTWWAKPHAGTPALASTEFACLQANGDFDLAALWLAVRVPGFHLELVRRVTGTSGSHQRVRPEDLLSIEVPDVGRLDRDTKERALGLLELVSERRVESVALDRLRDSLLPELLSGRMRVPVAQEDVA